MIKIKLKLNKYVFNIINFNKDKNIIINKNIFKCRWQKNNEMNLLNKKIMEIKKKKLKKKKK